MSMVMMNMAVRKRGTMSIGMGFSFGSVAYNWFF
jgi:hypothetical protein